MPLIVTWAESGGNTMEVGENLPLQTRLVAAATLITAFTSVLAPEASGTFSPLQFLLSSRLLSYAPVQTNDASPGTMQTDFLSNESARWNVVAAALNFTRSAARKNPSVFVRIGQAVAGSAPSTETVAVPSGGSATSAAKRHLQPLPFLATTMREPFVSTSVPANSTLTAPALIPVPSAIFVAPV